MKDMIPQHFMRFGIHSEKQFFLPPQFRESYDAVVLNGNLVAYSLKGVCSFISALLTGKPYFIDPITHAFGHHPQHISRQEETGKLTPKPAIKALAQQYGDPARAHVGKRALAPDDFDESSALAFTQRVLDFQQNIIARGLHETEDAKYLDVETRSPCFLIAPYFYLGPNSVDIWIDLNLKFIDIAVASGRQLPIFAEILVANDAFLDSELRESLLSKYTGCKATGIVLWIESFSEHSASLRALRGYRSFVEELAGAGKEIIVMYGGYFSIILHKYGVSAVCHGPGYGEEREVTPVGGGMPRPKFYYPSMHMRLPYREVAFALSGSDIDGVDKFYEHVCDCQMCREVLGNDLARFTLYGEAKSGIRKDGIAFEYATSEAKKIATAHYIYNKKREFEFIHNNDIPKIIQDLTDSYITCKDLFGINEAAHLKVWQTCLSD